MERTNVRNHVVDPLQPRLITMREAAGALGLSERHLRALKATGQLHVVRFGKRRVMVSLAEVDRLAAKGVQ